MPRKTTILKTYENASLWQDTIKDSELTALEKEVLLQLVASADIEPKNQYDRKRLLVDLNAQRQQSGEKDFLNETLGKILKRLVTIGVLQGIKTRADQLYVLQPNLGAILEAHADALKENKGRLSPAKSRQMAAAEAQMLQSAQGVGLLAHEPQRYYAQRLLNGVLDSAVRTGPHDRRDSINVVYPIPVRTENGYTYEHLPIKTVCRSGTESQVMEASDMAVVIALNSMFVEHIQRHYGSDPKESDIPNMYAFDILHLCERMGVSRHRRSTVAARLRRLRHTVFEIDVSGAPLFQQLYGYMNRDLVEFQFLTEFEVATEDVVVESSSQDKHEDLFQDDIIYHIAKTEGKSESDAAAESIQEQRLQREPRFYYIRFHSKHFQYLIANRQNHRFVAHDALTHERSGTAQRFNSWAKAFIGVRKKANRNDIFQCLIEEFQEALFPQLPKGRHKYFREEVFRLGQRFLVDKEKGWDDQGGNIALIYGYYLEIDFSPEAIAEQRKVSINRGLLYTGPGNRLKQTAVIRVWRDTEDEIVGDNSLHNQARRATAERLADYQ